MKHKSNILIVLGILMILAALGIFGYNQYEDQSVNQQNEVILETLEKKQQEDKTALYRQYPNIPMPVVEIDGLNYIGTIKAPAIDLNTPVLATYDAATMEVTPALYSGTAYQKNMLMLGHNYQSCFGKLANIKIGDEVLFIDNHKNEFYYEVIDYLIINENEFDKILSQEDPWDFTMFTCTWSGYDRVVIRCKLVKDIPAMMNM